MARRIFYKILLLALSILIGFFVAEAGLRLKNLIMRKHGPPGFRDQYGLAVLKPDLKGNFYSSESRRYPYIQTNADGFVGKTYALDKPDKAKRIAILGDSFVAAHQLDWDKNFVSRLDQKLAEQPLKSDALYEMMNFGINGVGTVEEMVVYDAYVKKYHPDLVVLVLFAGNDFSDNEEFLAKKESILNGDIDLLKKSDIEPNGSKNDGRGPIKRLILKSEFVSLILHIVRNTPSINQLFVRAGILKDLSKTSPLLEPTLANMLLYTDPNNERSLEALAFTADLLNKFREKVEKDDAVFLVVILPSHWQADESYAEHLKDINPSSAVDLPQSFLKNKLAKAALLDFTDIFKKAINMDSKQIYILGRGHLNEAGSIIAADALYEFLEDNQAEIFHD
ncbi:MAG TPA: hypothetical protein VJB92_04065 [Candidatus Paceibacterota bacterium]